MRVFHLLSMLQKKNFSLKLSNGIHSLQTRAYGTRKVCKVTQARCDLRDCLDPDQGCERKKVERWASNVHKKDSTATET